MSRRQSIYLAGPISGLTPEECRGWRRLAATALGGRYDIRDPLRGKNGPPYAGPLCEDVAIFRRDHHDVHHADVLLVNLLGAPKVSVFTVMEMAWAYQAGKVTVTVMEPEGNVHEHLCVRQATTLRYPSLGEAIAYLLDHH